MSKPVKCLLTTSAICIAVGIISKISGLNFAVMLAATSIAYSVAGTVWEEGK